ncbi:MAG: type VI secretion system ATPase TssH [Phycisphaerae bacterium]|nr:type VI secretion system ATPase TssH [Phycisphaerae bacterium]NIP53153.1 type VI secretion system ATPase TssH [Phycisphaerae bacterium]NIS52184.1 type VI secretion system ATPase TssH [Phycisphaerae bacterium]NIU09718.1 type VI secretion system ATPase TssH [Phycisphaerae bacterium]NIU57390.1 type VI secretion system ATPase TssH [Phycisphaerae bacterium]
MAEISRTSLFGKLNSIGYKAIEGATIFCKLRGNPYVELVHWLHQILKLPDSDLHRIIKHFEIDPSRLAADMTAELDRLPRGSTSISDLSSHLEESVERGWVYGSLLFGESQIRTGHLIVGILKTSGLKNVLLRISKEFDKVKLEQLTDSYAKIVAGSPEETLAATDGSSMRAEAEAGAETGEMAPAAMGKQEALAKFSVDLTEKARSAEMDPIVGRDGEIRQIVDILMRRRQNNPILTGEAGVGKTAVVEGFAQRIAAGDVPPSLKDVAVRVLDVGLLQAGASMKGEFENRLRQVIEEVQSSPKPIILFIDEAHTLIGAGGAAGTGDAANLLKPALARGTLRTIAATTWSEYKKYIEKDPALTRRFQVVKVDEPEEENALMMMRALASNLEKHHRVQILDEALDAAVRLSHRYIAERQLPDKAVSLTDTACARVAISQHAVPPELDDCRRRIQALETELEIVGRETATGVDHKARESEINEKLKTERKRQTELEDRWTKEKELVDSILDIRAKLRESGEGTIEQAEQTEKKASSTKKETEHEAEADETAEATAKEGEKANATEKIDRKQLLKELKKLQKQLSTLQGERPLILPCVDAQAVGSVVADWTGIPVGGMVRNEIEAILHLDDRLRERVIGQDHALAAVAKRIKTSRAGIENPNRPIAVMFLVGPSGVGKTETALALAEALYGDESNITTINMSEFQEAHTVSTLKGSPPGYVGYGEGGVLTEAVRRRPYSIVLLDEVEKAHRDVHEIFFQVFDKGQMEDAEGRLIDFKNTIILLTSNVGTDLIMDMCKDPKLMPEPEGICKALRKPLLEVFPAALLGRLVVVPFYPISDETLRLIIRLQLGRIGRRTQENHKIPFTYDDKVIELIASRCTEVESGARMVDAILTNTLLPEVSQELLTRLMEGKTAKRVHVGVKDSEFTYSFD